MRPSNYLNQQWTQKHGKYVPKMQFKTLAHVLRYMSEHHIKDYYTPYVCSICGMWHIGHRHTKKKKR